MSKNYGDPIARKLDTLHGALSEYDKVFGIRHSCHFTVKSMSFIPMGDLMIRCRSGEILMHKSVDLNQAQDIVDAATRLIRSDAGGAIRTTYGRSGGTEESAAKVQDGSTFFNDNLAKSFDPAVFQTRDPFVSEAFARAGVTAGNSTNDTRKSMDWIRDLNRAGELVHEIRQRVNFEEKIDNASMLPQMTFIDDVTIRLKQCNTNEVVATTFDTPKEAIAAARLLLAFLGPKPMDVPIWKPETVLDKHADWFTNEIIGEGESDQDDAEEDAPETSADQPEGRVEIVVYVDDNRVAEITDLQGLIQLGTVHAPRIAAEIERMTAAMEIATGRR